MEDNRVDADAVSRVLPEAIRRRGDDDSALAEALSPTVEKSIERSVNSNPQPLIDAIFPVIGPAIRRAIGAALASMMESLNTALENSISPRGLRWRLEAYRTGKPFAEVALLHSIVLRVEQVFLIHRETGLLLHHVSQPGIEAEDADMVSAMLTAIGDFVSDSFSGDAPVDLHEVEFGDRRLQVAQSPAVLLVAVVRGTPSAELRHVQQHTLEKLYSEASDDLRGFTGDVAPFTRFEPLLSECLVESRQEVRRPERRRPRVWIALGLVAVSALALWLITSVRAERRRQRALDLIGSEPGLVLLEVADGADGTIVRGLRDPLAREPSAILADHDEALADLRFEWTPFYSLEPELVGQRARERLSPPEGVRLSLEDGVLSLAGQAPGPWVRSARTTARQLPGVLEVNDSGLVDLDERELRFLSREFEAASLRFERGWLELTWDAEALERVRGELSALDASARRNGQLLRVHVRGSVVGAADSEGVALARERAEFVRSELEELGLTNTFLDSALELQPPTPQSQSSGTPLRTVRVGFDVELLGD